MGRKACEAVVSVRDWTDPPFQSKVDRDAETTTVDLASRRSRQRHRAGDDDRLPDFIFPPPSPLDARVMHHQHHLRVSPPAEPPPPPPPKPWRHYCWLARAGKGARYGRMGHSAKRPLCSCESPKSGSTFPFPLQPCREFAAVSSCAEDSAEDRFHPSAPFTIGGRQPEFKLPVRVLGARPCNLRIA